MSEAKFKTMRHIEAVRNLLIICVNNLLLRSALHDQSKLESPEVEFLETHTHKLRTLTYGSPEYFACLEEMKPGLENHYKRNPHHPEYHQRGIHGMTLLDLIEMLCDWKAASKRHDDGNVIKSIEMNQSRYGYSDELKNLLINTAKWLNDHPPYVDKAHES